MRVLHVSGAKSWRGGEQQIAYLVEELAGQGIPQFLFCPTGSPMESYCAQHVIPFQTYNKVFSVNPLVSRQLARFVTQQKIDLVHLHDSHAHTLGCMAASFFGMTAPMVLHRRVIFTSGKGILSQWKYNHPGIKGVICVSQNVKSVLSRTIKDKDKIKVIHSGVDVNRFAQKSSNKLRMEFNVPDEQIIIANIAAITKEKDYFTFVQTAELLLNAGLLARFFIVGKGKQKIEIAQLVAEKGLTAQFVFTGFREDVMELLPGIDVLLFTSKEEGFGTTLIDAQLSGVPIVATNAGGIPEIIEAGKTGLLAEVGDAYRLAQNVNELLRNQELRKKIIAEAKHSALRFSKEHMARETLKIYETLLNNC